MDVQQLKLLAGRIRGLLEHANVTVSHSQALDLSGALVGLRNWPEVQAFPARVSAAELDLAAAGRLAYRLERHHSVQLSREELWDALRPPASATREELLPQVWPAGPKPGVYVTTSQEHLNALLASYDEATDGHLVYAERAGNHWQGSIDLGEDGLWSAGMERLPSGTLLVVGPVNLNQQSWGDAATRLEMACLHVQVSGHRVAVLVETDSPNTLFHDLDVLVRMKEPEGDDTHEALTGIVTEAGDLVERSPFVTPLPAPVAQRSVAPLEALPLKSLPLLQHAFERRKTGLLLVGSSEIEEHWAVELVNALLPLTDFAGPAARIKPRHRSTPAKDWNVPDATKALPFLPSIESAYSLGYRRMVINPTYTDGEVLVEYGNDVLFIGGAYGSSVDDLFLSGLRYRGSDQAKEALATLVAILAVTRLKTAKLNVGLADMYIPDGREPLGDDKFSAVLAMMRDGRVLRAEDELSELMDQKRVTPSAVKNAVERTKWVTELLAERAKPNAVTTR
ncbi:MAG: hypothetical protein Q8N13_03210 [Acidovorax sp.]|nr:hypothetical protein [Acidovorax sp.]